MADHEALKAQADEAFAAGQQYLTADGWTVIDSTDGFVTSLHPTDNVPVLKVEGHINKAPEFFSKFIPRNGLRIREQYFRYHVRAELVEVFPDHSRLTKEVMNIPGVGEFEQIRYYSLRTNADGTSTAIGTSAKLPQYPPSVINLTFFIVHVLPTEGGSTIQFVFQSNSTVPMDDAARLASALVIKDYYIGIAKEINAAADE